ncbi:acetamidase/formamidase family protein [Tardisphaera miroshnichenkoae]
MLSIDGNRPRSLHYKWSNKLEPIAEVNPEEEFKLAIPDSSGGQIGEDWTTEDMKKLDESKFDGALGPIYVRGAKKGDVLEVEIREISTATWGWTAILSDFGVMKGVFPNRLIIWNLSDGYATSASDFLKGIRVPLRPFLGVVGTAPSDYEYPMIPPQAFGGNMDNPLLVAGSKLFLPVNVDGALLSFSDPHASQGEGEVCGTAIETRAEVRAVVRIRRDLKLSGPLAVVPEEPAVGPSLVAMGISCDLREALRKSLESLTRSAVAYGLKEEEAYVLHSVAGRLSISEAVDEPNYVVSSYLPLALFASRSSRPSRASLPRTP